MEITSKSLDELLARAEAASFAGRDGEAEKLLIDVRRNALLKGDGLGAARAEVGLAWAALAADDDDRAQMHAEAAEELVGDEPECGARVWVARSTLARRASCSEPARAPLAAGARLSPATAALLDIDAAAWNLHRGQTQRACDNARSALLLADDGTAMSAWARIVLGRALCLQSDWPHARDSFEAGMDTLARLELPRLLGRAQLLYACELAAHLEPDAAGSPLSWLGRAATALRTSSTWRDRTWLGEGFRRFGQGSHPRLEAIGRAASGQLEMTRARYSFHDIVGDSPAMLDALRVARQAATVDANVLITGESGAGKELFAQAIHNGGPRASEPFVGVNCAALSREQLEAELFGSERGALHFEETAGKFELAGEGTILLDEIGCMPLEVQAKVVRVLQERAVTRLGGSSERPMKARVIATTQRDLDQLVGQGAFRLDLLYRLRVLQLHIPSLEERTEDVAVLARTFLARAAEAQRKAASEMSGEVVQALLAHTWKGNVRELANVIEREVSFLAADTTMLSRLRMPLAPPLERADDSQPPPVSGPVIRLVDVERRAFLEALRACGGNVPRAAKALGVSKVTFYARLREWGMHPRDKCARVS